jgi:hypothetical protein
VPKYELSERGAAAPKKGNKMGFVVLNIKKNNSSGGGLGHHIDRTPGMNHMYKNADAEKANLNRHWKLNDNCKLPLGQAINARIEQGYKGKTAIRKDAVKSLSLVLTGSHDAMKKIFSNKETAADWIQKNAEFISEQYGYDNIVRFTLHEDERTPHLHVVVVPLTKDGRLSAKEVMGNKQNLKNLRTEYANRMEQFGLERGLERSPDEKPTAKTIDNFYKTIQEVENVKKIDSKQLLSISPRDKTDLLKKVIDGEKIAELIKNRSISKDQKI